MTNTMTYDKKAEDKEMKSAIEVPSSLWMRCRQIVVEHGSTRKAADAIGVDHAYLHRLANGECDNPSDEVLAKLGLRKIVDIRYESVDAHGSFYDAYAGAREDMLVWKKRALLAEAQLKAEIDLRNATPTRMVVEGRKLTRHEIDRCASYAIETDILPRESWEDAGLYDFAHALNGGIGVVDDLAMWIRRLARSLEKSNPMNALPRLAMDYLKRHGLEGGPLRAEPAATASRTVNEQVRDIATQPSPDAAQGGEQGEVPQELRAVEALIHEVLSMPDDVALEGEDAAGLLKLGESLLATAKTRAPHPSQAGAEAVDEGMVSVPVESLRCVVGIVRHVGLAGGLSYGGGPDGEQRRHYEILQSALSRTKA